MRQNGRKSALALAVVDDDAAPSIVTPPGLTAAERVVWMTTVASKPGDWFGSEHGPLLVEYVRAVCRAQVIDAEIKKFDSEWLATTEGLVRFDRLAVLATKTSVLINRLATSMRLTQQSTVLPDRAKTKSTGRTWLRDAKP